MLLHGEGPGPSAGPAARSRTPRPARHGRGARDRARAMPRRAVRAGPPRRRRWRRAVDGATGRAEPREPAIETQVRATRPAWLAQAAWDGRVGDDPFARQGTVDDDAAE